MNWNRLVNFCRFPVVPIYYDYGGTLVYQGNNVYYNGAPITTADQYAQQAAALAQQGVQAPAPDNGPWEPLGVFGAIQSDEKEATHIFQLAINANGVLRGNYYNALSDTSLPVFGSVDPKTQRAAWIIGDRKDVVYETGIGNLTQPQTNMLVHFGTDRTQQWTLVRLEQPPAPPPQ